MTAKPSFVSELRRRNVLRMAGLYLVGAWLVVQVASTVLPMFGAPDWLPRGIVIALTAGFIPALVFSWVFELTPAGLKRDADVPLQESIAPQTARRLDRAIIVVLALAVAFFCVDRFALAPRRDAALVATTTTRVAAQVRAEASAVTAKSIAVLAFIDLSPGHDQGYFADGMSEEILNALAQVPDLKVAGRTSSFYFKGRNADLRTIGKTLGVAHILEGSVRKQGDKVRITAQLIRVADDTHLWSRDFDGDMGDVFKLQDDIARAITEQLKITLVGEKKAQLVPVATRDNAAHALYLQAREAYQKRGAGLQRSVALYHAALARDPQFAAAWAGLCGSLNVLPFYLPEDRRGEIPQVQRDAEAACLKAIAIDPDLASPHIMLGNLYTNEWRWKDAEPHFLRAQALAPSDPEFLFAYTDWLGAQGRVDDALEAARRAVEGDPMAPMYRNLYGYLLSYADRNDECIVQMRAGYAIAPDNVYLNRNLMICYVAAGRIDEAEALRESHRQAVIATGESAAGVARANALFDAMIAIGRQPGRYDAIRDALVKDVGKGGLLVATVFRPHPDDMFALVEDMVASHASGSDPLVLLRGPLFAAYHDDPRYQRLLLKTGFDAAGNPR